MKGNITRGAIFKHYKGNLYEFIAIATHSESLEELVVYKALYGDRGIWVRPKAMFFEQVIFNNQEVPRFAAYISEV